MERRQTSLASSRDNHLVDIHEVLAEEDEEEGEEMGTTRKEDKADKRLGRPIKIRDAKRPYRSLNRQVSLETGFSELNRELKAKDERTVLPRSGRSLGRFDSANRIGLESRKVGDFSFFKTKSSLSKQNSLLPSRKERETLECQRSDGSVGQDDSVNRSVPAGRYFAALRGPELDQVKVMHSNLH